MTRNRTTVIAIAAILLLTAAGTACSSSDSGSDTGSGGGGGTPLTVRNFEFDPNTLSVASGETTITITNEGSVKHSFTLDDGSVDQDIEPGESATVTVNVTENAPFHCKYHPTQMTGTLEVS